MSSTHGTHLRRWALSLPPVEFLVQQLRELLIGSLRCGPIPQHIAFVMDGNRRFARSRGLETVEGHHLGFEALAKILEVCYKSGVRVVTIYAFSIENFSRPRYEVDGLMDLAKTKLLQMSQHGDLLDRYGASVRVIGDRSLLRDDVLKQVDKAVEMTAHNQNAILNVCFPYTGREEITRSIREAVREYSAPSKRPAGPKRPFSETHIQRNIQNRKLSDVAEDAASLHGHDQSLPEGAQPNVDGTTFSSDGESVEFSEPDSNLQPASSRTSHSPSPVRKGNNDTVRTSNLPDPESISVDTLDKNTYTSDCPPLDLLIRTSKVQRLSDFMLWQCHEDTQIEFLNCMWPEFDLWHFLPVLLEWQWRQKKLQESGKTGLVADVKVA